MADDNSMHVDSASAGGSERDEIIARLKSELKDTQERASLAQQRAHVFEERERERLTSYQSESSYFITDFLKDEIEKYHSDTTNLLTDVAPLTEWVNEYTKKKDIVGQAPLAAATYVASKGIKRLRDAASRSAELESSLASALKENEDLRASRDKFQKESSDALQLAEERQKGLSILEQKLIDVGAINQKFDFSKLSSREVSGSPNSENTTATSAAASSDANMSVASILPSEPASMLNNNSAMMNTVTACASKKASSSSSSANPLERTGDLLETLLARSGGGLRMTSSGTGHSLLGASDGSNFLQTLRAAGL
jgi:hypothetical protein